MTSQRPASRRGWDVHAQAVTLRDDVAYAPLAKGAGFFGLATTAIEDVVRLSRSE